MGEELTGQSQGLASGPDVTQIRTGLERCPFAFCSVFSTCFLFSYLNALLSATHQALFFSLLPTENFCSYIHFTPMPHSFPKSWDFHYRLSFVSKWHHGPRLLLSLCQARSVLPAWLEVGKCTLWGLRLLAFLGRPSSRPL